MITEMITDQLTDLSADTTTVATLAFMIFFAIHFFINMKPAIDSKRRINRQANRRYENYVASNQARQKIAEYNKKNPSNKKSPKSYKTQSLKNDKGYQAYLRRNAPKFMVSQDKKHKAYLKLVQTKSRPNSSTAVKQLNFTEADKRWLNSIGNPSNEKRRKQLGKRFGYPSSFDGFKL